MTREEYHEICVRLAREAIAYAARMAADENGASKDVSCPKCARPAGATCAFTTSGQDAPEGFVHNERAVAALDAQREHWIDVFLDEHLPDVDPDALLAVTSHVDVWLKASGSFYATVAVRAFAAFQADVWDAINRTEAP